MKFFSQTTRGRGIGPQYAKWLDHATPWASWGSLAASGVFSNWEMLYMALPLLAAAAVGAAQLKLSRWRLLLEFACLSVIAIGRLAKLGWVLTVILLLFALSGARLSLPRSHATRIQVIFMSFLIFLITTIANSSFSFLPWALIWTATAGLALFQLNLEGKAGAQKRPAPVAPFGRVAIWTAAAASLGALIFLALPRPPFGWRPLPFGVHGLSGSFVGLSDTLSLDGGGPIQGNGEVVARILPPPDISDAQRMAMERRMSLLVGQRLEIARGGKWEMRQRTAFRSDIEIFDGWNEWAETLNAAEYFVYPSPTGLIPMPYGRLRLFPPSNMRIFPSRGGALRWSYPLARPMPFKFRLYALEPEILVDERYTYWQALRNPDPATIEALHWSLRLAPRGTPTADLVGLLTDELRAFAYTLDNPSGSARDSLADFLNRTRAGHCEYFAHALASALRHRGVASRVVNGYRLGLWIQEGGYWLITQNEAHSWVEYVDPDTNIWTVADPTPPSGTVSGRQWYLTEKMGRMMDAMRFRWDRYVVRFSGTEQQKGALWVRARGAKIWGMRPSLKTLCAFLAASAALILLLGAWRKRGLIGRLFNCSATPGAVAALRPLIRSSRLQPLPGETIRGWFGRLAQSRPERRGPLMTLAGLIEGRVYGQSESDISRPIKEEAREWKKGVQAPPPAQPVKSLPR